MSSADGPGADPQGLGPANAVAGDLVHSQLVEALVLLLIEKGVLTKNDALSIVQTVAQVQRGLAVEGREAVAQMQAVEMLRRMYASFEALADGPGALSASAENVIQLRPPTYGDSLEFPRAD